MKAFSKKSLLAAASLLALPVMLHGQATRTWVSGVGDDANPCSRTAPGQTFAGAIAKTAPGGVIDVLDPGGFGAVTITKAITIDGVGAPGGINVFGSNAIVVSAGPTDIVVLRNLNLNGLGGGSAGIVVNTALAVIVENCNIAGFQNGISFLSSTSGAQLFLRNVTIDNCSQDAVSLAPSVASTIGIINSHFSDCGVGLSVAPHATVNVTDTVSSGHGGAGFITTAAGAILTLTRCVASDNNVGVQSSGTITLNDCDIFDNVTNGLKFVGTAQLNTFDNNSVNGNTPDGSSSTFPLPKK
jgi:hypothetical protein